MEKRVKLDPFNHDALNIVTTVMQIASAIIGLVMLLKGNEAGLLGLGALAGGVRGNILGDFLTWYRSNGPKPPRFSGTALVLLLASGVLLSGCGTTVSKQFLVDSQSAVMSTASDYLLGCRTVTVAPAFIVDWNENVTYGGGLFAGCESEGHLVEFRCMGIPDEETGKLKVNCDPLALWNLQEDDQ